MPRFLIDMHCHPAMKPYGKSFRNEATQGHNDTDPWANNSVWYYDPPTGMDKAVNKVLTITKFSQSNFSALSFGNVRLICASLYPMEKGFVKNNAGSGAVSDLLMNFLTGQGQQRINHLQAMPDYFTDLTNEYYYYKELDGKIVDIAFGENPENKEELKDKHRYILIKNYNDLLLQLEKDGEDDITNIYVIITIEGLHVLDCGLGTTPDREHLLKNLKAIQAWQHRPLFITFAHHFYNQLCGHAESLKGIADWATHQETGMGEGLTPLGEQVLHQMIADPKTRIYVDIKHMSVTARYRYYELLQTTYANEFNSKQLPIVISHGACSGLQSAQEPYVQLHDTGNKMMQADINFYDEEILLLAKSGGIIGIQLDERRLGNKSFLNSTGGFLNGKNKRLHKRSKLVWNQIQHIAELLDNKGLFAWDCMAIGTDFDGIIDPVNGFWTSEEMDDLVQYLERHVYDYINEESDRLQNAFNRLEPAEIIDRIFHDNAMEFFRKYFK